MKSEIVHPRSIDILGYTLPWTPEKFIKCYKAQIVFYERIGNLEKVEYLKESISIIEKKESENE